MKVFLSYASEQRSVANATQLALVALGHDVFFDRSSLPPGGDYNARIHCAIDDSVGMIFLISPESVSSGSYALTELKFAREKWRHPRGCVLPVMAAPTPYENIPVFLKAVTILEPEGNTAAEVAAEVEKRPLGNSHPDVIRTVSAISRELESNQSQLASSRKLDVAVYLDGIGTCLQAVYKDLSEGIHPHGRCGELQGYAADMAQAIGSYIGQEKAEGLGELLGAAYNVEDLYISLGSPEERKRLPEIARAAGRFTALANAVRAGLG